MQHTKKAKKRKTPSEQQQISPRSSLRQQIEMREQNAATLPARVAAVEQEDKTDEQITTRDTADEGHIMNITNITDAELNLVDAAAAGFDSLVWNEEVLCDGDDILCSAYVDGVGRITVLDRLTGFGWRDVESGFKDTDGKFWLASGNFDIRQLDVSTIRQAIEKIKKANANT